LIPQQMAHILSFGNLKTQPSIKVDDPNLEADVKICYEKLPAVMCEENKIEAQRVAKLYSSARRGQIDANRHAEDAKNAIAVSQAQTQRVRQKSSHEQIAAQFALSAEQMDVAIFSLQLALRAANAARSELLTLQSIEKIKIAASKTPRFTIFEPINAPIKVLTQVSKQMFPLPESREAGRFVSYRPLWNR